MHQPPRHDQRIHAHQGRAHPAVVEHGRPDLAGVVKTAVKSLAVSAGLLHADVRRDVALGEAGLEGFIATGLGHGRGRRDLQELASVHTSECSREYHFDRSVCHAGWSDLVRKV